MGLCLNRDTLGSCFFLRTEITLKGATYQISFSDADQLPPPFRIDNISEVSRSGMNFSYLLPLVSPWMNHYGPTSTRDH